jgi:hypothetical protein
MEAMLGLKDFANFTQPVDQFSEQVFFHEVSSREEDGTFAALINERLGPGIYIKYNSRQLPMFVQWKSMMSGDYALGLEPTNSTVHSQYEDNELGALKSVKSQEKIRFDLEIGILDGFKKLTHLNSSRKYEFNKKYQNPYRLYIK